MTLHAINKMIDCQQCLNAWNAFGHENNPVQVIWRTFDQYYPFHRLTLKEGRLDSN